MATTLTLEETKQFVGDHFEDFVNKRNAAVIRKNMTSDFHDHDGPGGKPAGVDGDELHLTIEDMIAEGDKVVCRNIALDGIGRTTGKSRMKPQEKHRINLLGLRTYLARG